MTAQPHITDPKESAYDSILQAATQEFARKGFDGARVDEIAHYARVNKATIYYRVGDKETLYEAVLSKIHSQLADRLASETQQMDSPRDRLRRYIEIFAEEVDAQPFTSAIMMREVASGGRHLPDGALGHMARNFATLRSILDQGMGEGAFREVNPIAIHRLIIGSILLHTTDAPIRQRLARQMPGDAPPPAFLSHQDLSREVNSLIQAAITA
jgi:AcrR family transcriptional regulator